MTVKECLLSTALQILKSEQASEADRKLAEKVRAELGAQRIYEKNLVLLLYETASARGHLTDKIKLIKKDQIEQMAGSPHLDLISEAWDRQAQELARRIAGEEPADELERCYQRLRYDSNIGLSHLICSQYPEHLCAALSSVAAKLIKPERWRCTGGNCLSGAVYSCQPKERIYRLLTHHLRTKPHWNSRSIRSEIVTQNPFRPSFAPEYDKRDQYLSQYPCLVSLYSNLQLYRRIKDIQKEIREPTKQTDAGAGIDFSLLQAPKIYIGNDPPGVDFALQFGDDGDLPLC